MNKKTPMRMSMYFETNLSIATKDNQRLRKWFTKTGWRTAYATHDGRKTKAIKKPLPPPPPRIKAQPTGEEGVRASGEGGA